MTTQQVIISDSPEQLDILLAELGEINFNIFEDLDTGVIAYCQTDLFDLSLFSEVIKKYEVLGPISFQINEIEKLFDKDQKGTKIFTSYFNFFLFPPISYS